jgi:hypothetical protein
MRGCLRIAAGLTAVAFIVVTAFAFLLSNLAQVAGERQAIKRAIDGEGLLRDTLLQLANDAVVQQAEATGLPPIDPNVLRRSLDQLIPAGWIGVQTNAAIDATFDYLEDERITSPEIAIDVAPFMAALRGEPGLQAINTVVQSLPVCAGPHLYPNLAVGRFEIPLCIPPELNVPLMSTLVHTSLAQLLDFYPMLLGDGIIRWRILEDTPISPQVRTSLEQFRDLFQFSQRWHWLLWLLPPVFLFFLLILDVRSLASLGHWWGWSILFAALFTLFLAFFLPYLADYYFRMASPWPGGDPAAVAITQFVRAVLRALMDVWLQRVMWQAALLLPVGLFFIVLGFLGNALGYASRPSTDHYPQYDDYWQ